MYSRRACPARTISPINLEPTLGEALRACLLFTVGPHTCAIPLEHVVETFRPPRIEPVATPARCVLGVARIRGEAVPVIDVGALAFGSAPTLAPARLVTLRVGGRVVALAVSDVTRVAPLADVDSLPPLLRTSDAIEGIASLDDRLLLVLRAARLVDEAGPM